LSNSEESRVENISFFLLKAMNAGESVEDKSDVIVADGTIF
jgi:hypothetical protein